MCRRSTWSSIHLHLIDTGMPSCSISVPGPPDAVPAGHTTYGSRKRDPEDGFAQDPLTATAISFSFPLEH